MEIKNIVENKTKLRRCIFLRLRFSFTDKLIFQNTYIYKILIYTKIFIKYFRTFISINKEILIINILNDLTKFQILIKKKIIKDI